MQNVFTNGRSIIDSVILNHGGGIPVSSVSGRIFPIVTKPEGFRAPANGISASLQQGVEGEAVIIYCKPLATRVADPVEDGDLESSGFPALVRA